MSTEENKTILFKLIAKQGLAQVLAHLESYCDSKADNAHGDYKIANNWKAIGNQVFKARQETMKREI